MPKIIVKNSCIKIEDYEPQSNPLVERMFMVYDPSTYTYKYVALHYDSNTKTLYLPRGIDIWWLENHFGTEAIVERDKYNKFDFYKKSIKMKYLPRDKDQIEALQFAVGKGKYELTLGKSQLSINLNTGKGKTYVAIGAMSIFGIKSMVITYAKAVLTQWKNNILEYTNIKEDEIYSIDGSGSIYLLLLKKPSEIKKIKVFLVTHGTLKSYGDSKGWESVTSLFEFLKVGLKFYDEAHTNFDNMCMIDYYTNVFKTYYLTATPARSNSEEDNIYQYSFKNVYAIDLFHEDTDPHTHYLAMRYNSRPTAQAISYCKNRYGLDRNKYTNYIVTNQRFRMMAVVVINFILTKIFKSPYDQMIIYIGTNEAISEIFNLICTNFTSLRNDIGVFSSMVDDEDKQFALSKRIILTTTKSAGAAIDIKNLKCTLVLAEPFKSKVLAMQSLGRTRNHNTYYIEVVDKGFLYCDKYYISKRPVFNKYALDNKLVEFTDLQLDNTYIKIMKESPVLKYGIIPGDCGPKPFTFAGLVE